MADEKKLNGPDDARPQSSEGGAEPEQDDKKKKKPKKEKKPKDKSSKFGGPLKWILIGVGVIGIEAGLAYVVMQKINAPPKPVSESHAEETEPEKPKKKPPKKHGEGAPVLEEFGYLAPINDIVVNPALSQGRQFFVVSVVLGLQDEETHKVAVASEPILRDRFIQFLAKKTFNWFKNYDNSEIIKTEITRIAEEVLECPGEVRVYFTKYVVQ